MVNSVESALLRIELIKQVEERLRVLQIFAKIINFILAGSFEVVIEPTQQELFDWKLGEVFQRLTIIEEFCKLRTGFKDDFLSGDGAKDLPHEGEDLMRSPVDEVLGADARQL